MSGLLSKLNATSNKKPIEPREIFMGLPQKNAQYQYPRDVQADVWKKWFPIRNQKNCIIKMNTGSGKTVVGLLILQSCLNEGKGPAAYVVPDKYLVSQVIAEAARLGIRVTDNRDDYMYSENKSILVMPIQSMINGKSVFGMRVTGNYPLGSVLIDDVHACLDTITSQFSIQIPSSHELYNKLVSLFSERWKAYNPTSYEKIVETQDPLKSMLIPFWMWQDSSSDVLKLLSSYANDNEENKNIFFSLPLLEDNISVANCIITAKGIEIIPFGINIAKIKEFENAQRRIFMSATLADDSVFVSDIGLHENDVQNIITPDNANDLGDRLILFPRHLNNAITNEEIRAKILSISAKYNVVVIVPSRERARFWDAAGQCTVDRTNIVQSVDMLKNRQSGLFVFVNRYDGIDLPNDACRMLVIDGLPPMRNEYDKYIQSVDPSSGILLREQVQKIEQGMGRGVRASNDSCCVVLMGDNLGDVLVRNRGASYFGPATAAQYQLSKELWDLLKEETDSPSVDEVFELADYSLNRNVEWIQMSKDRLSSINYESVAKIDKISLALRSAYEYACSQRWNDAVQTINHAISPELSDLTKGYLSQIKASYINFFDKASAQQVQLSAHKLNASVLCPIDGIQYNKVFNTVQQAKAVCAYAKDIVGNPNEYLLYWDSISTKLSFSPDADGFEEAFESLGKLLGFVSTRPDKETNGAGPDNLWALGDRRYLVVECKSGATVDTISKSYCNQLGGSIRWFNSAYGPDYTCQPVIIHPSVVVDRQASPPEAMRIMTREYLDQFKQKISSFIVAMVHKTNWLDENQVDSLLQQYQLRGKDIIAKYTIDFTMK